MRRMKKKTLTRRQLAGAMLAGVAAAQMPADAAADANAELQAAREQNQKTAEAVGKVKVPTPTEPAFHFTA